MKKTTNKLISVILVLILVLGMMPTIAYAANRVVYASTTDELINAIASDTTIYLEGKDYYLYEKLPNNYVRTLIIAINSVNNLSIIGTSGTRLLTCRRNDVFHIKESSNIDLRNLILTHVEDVEELISGGILYARDVNGLSLDNCDIFGTGNTAFLAFDSTGTIKNSKLRDFDLSIFDCSDSEFTVTDCTFSGNGQKNFYAIDLHRCTLTFTRCTFSDNKNRYLYNLVDESGIANNVTFTNCVFYRNAFDNDGGEDIPGDNTCGENLTWSWNDSTNTLTISGTGAMYDYDFTSDVPWYPYRSEINNIVITSGITGIGQYSFYTCQNLKTITIPDSVTTIGGSALWDKPSSLSIFYPNSKAKWNNIDILDGNEWLPFVKIYYDCKGFAYQTPLEGSGIFHYGPTQLGGADQRGIYYYDEESFFNVSTSMIYNHDLAKMSMKAALSAYGTERGKTLEEQNILGLMHDLSFEHMVADYPMPTEADSIGYAIGSKNIAMNDGKSCTLIMLAIRGGGYVNEWCGNFRVGDEECGVGTNHCGFEIAADKVLVALNEYIDEYGEDFDSEIKLWITGYSRAAATANMVAAKLDDGEISKIKGRNIFAYCFECPQNTRSSNARNEKYNNIHNIINPIDFVTMVAPSTKGWDFTRYGQNYFIPNEKTSLTLYRKLKPAMTEMYAYYLLQNGFSYDDADVKVKECTGVLLNQEHSIDDLFDTLAKTLSDPLSYTVYAQSDVMELVRRYLGDGQHDERSKLRLIDDLLDSALSSMGKKGITAEIDGTGRTLDLAGRALVNIETLKNMAYGHYPELCMAWLDSLNGVFVDYWAFTRKTFINCPVNVSVYDSDGNLVAQIIDDVVQEIENGIPAYIDFDGQKVICMPTDSDFRLEITATDDGEMTYTVTKYNMDTNETECVTSYYAVPIQMDDELTGIVENVAGVETYTLSGDEGALTPSIVLEGNEVETYDVSTTASGNGAVLGGGNYVVGEFAKVTALADVGEKFLGWYQDEVCVSTEAEYRFAVTTDTTLVGRFTSLTPATSGSCGDNLTWSWDDANKTLTISGSGSMYDYNYYGGVGGPDYEDDRIKENEAPWIQYAPTAENVVLPTGLTHIGVCAFADFANMKQITIPSSVGSIGKGAFLFCLGLEDVYFPETRAQWNKIDIDDNNESLLNANMHFKGSEHTPSYDYCTLTFDTNGGSYIAPITKIEGTNVSLASYKPTKAGFDFTGWYGDAALNTKITSVTLNSNKTVYAGWQKENPQTGGWVNPFIDVFERDWFYDDVRFAHENDLMKGTSNNTFSPNMTTTRGMIVTILYRLEGEPTVSGACPFDDVKSGSYYEKAITWAAAKGIVKGYGDNKFGPDDEITREQMAAILYRYADYKDYDLSAGENTNILSYEDAFDISDYAITPFQWACGEGLINGMGDGTLAPQGNGTRAQIAAILHRFIDKFVK